MIEPTTTTIRVLYDGDGVAGITLNATTFSPAALASLAAELAATQAREAALRAALAEYADPENWFSLSPGGLYYGWGWEDEHGYERAQAALIASPEGLPVSALLALGRADLAREQEDRRHVALLQSQCTPDEARASSAQRAAASDAYIRALRAAKLLHQP